MPAIIALGWPQRSRPSSDTNDADRDSQLVAATGIHCVEPSRPSRSGVLFIHGATFPTRLASGFEFSPDDSWLAFVAAEGYLACGFDFVGFGASSRPAAMLEAADRAAPVLRAPEAAEQIALAVRHLRGKRGLATCISSLTNGALCAAAFRRAFRIDSSQLVRPFVPRRTRATGSADVVRDASRTAGAIALPRLTCGQVVLYPSR